MSFEDLEDLVIRFLYNGEIMALLEILQVLLHDFKIFAS